MELTLRIVDISRSGPGVARESDGRVIFVPFTAPGDLVRVEIISEEKRYAEARLLEILEPSPQRITPKCPVFSRCGGCDWQHFSYEEQWEFKRKGILHSLNRVGIKTETIPFEDFPAEHSWHYRNRIQLKGFGDELGFYEKGTKKIIPVEKCWIAREEINERIAPVLLESKNFHREYKVEIEVHDNGSVTETWNRGHSAHGFRQVHNEQNSILQKWVQGHVGTGDVLLDLFGGGGNLSLGCRENFGEIHCVDIGAPKAPTYNIQFHRRSVGEWLRMNRDALLSKDVTVIFDPPREGLGRDEVSILETLRNLRVKKILSIGCETDTWVRSLNRMLRYGWQLQSLGALDFFPQTHHIEALAVLEKKNAT